MVLPFKSSGSSRSLSNYVESVASTSSSNSTTLDVDNVEKRGRKRQKVWDHFTKDDKGRAECKYCTNVPARANESMKKHLLNCNVFKSSGHNVSEIFLELQQKSLQRIQAEQAYLTFSKERADDLLAKMMFTSGASFTLLENPYFKEFVECLNPQYAPFGRRHLVENLIMITWRLRKRP